MTRGQQENLVLVVTDGHDLDEARDVLETILATDRADIPATTQRRELAKQDRRPALQPRCAIPDWFAELHNTAAAGGATQPTRSGLSEAKRARLQQAITVAEQQLAGANEACRPFDNALEAASETVAAAKETQRAAQVRLSESGLRHRRARRADLATADERLGLAEQELAAAKQQVDPTNRRASRRPTKPLRRSRHAQHARHAGPME